MRIKVFKIFVLLFCSGIWGCYPDKFDPEGDDVGPVATLDFSDPSVEFKALSASREVTVTTNYKSYRVEVSEEASGWCHVTADGMTLRIVVDENPFSRERSATIAVSVAKGSKELTKTVSVFQAGMLPQVKHSPSQLIFGQDDIASQVLTVTTNQDSWGFEKHGEWFTAERTGNTLKVTPNGRNSEKEERQGYITLTSYGEGDDKTAQTVVLLEQFGTDPALRLTENVFSLSPEGGVFRTRVITNQPSWKIYRGNGSWYEVRAEGDEVVLSVDRNTGETGRKTEIVVASGNDHVFENMSVAQLGRGLSLEVSLDTIRMDAAESFATLRVTTNADEWTAYVSGGDGWCELMKDGDRLTVCGSENKATDRVRTCRVVVSAGALNKEVCVIQYPHVTLELNHEFLQFEADAAQETVTVMTNQSEWTVEVPEYIRSWCSVIREGNVLTVFVESNRDPNKATEARSGEIVVKTVSAGIEKRRILRIEQKGIALLHPGGEVEDWDLDTTITGSMTLLQEERDVLIEFYYEMNGDDWTESTWWKSRRPLSEWKGVTTDAEGFVTGLELEANNLSGCLTSRLSKLSRLSRLCLSGNHITGTIPVEIQQMKGYDKSRIAPQRDESGNVVYLVEE